MPSKSVSYYEKMIENELKYLKIPIPSRHRMTPDMMNLLLLFTLGCVMHTFIVEESKGLSDSPFNPKTGTQLFFSDPKKKHFHMDLFCDEPSPEAVSVIPIYQKINKIGTKVHIDTTHRLDVFSLSDLTLDMHTELDTLLPAIIRNELLSQEKMEKSSLIDIIPDLDKKELKNLIEGVNMVSFDGNLANLYRAFINIYEGIDGFEFLDSFRSALQRDDLLINERSKYNICCAVS